MIQAAIWIYQHKVLREQQGTYPLPRGKWWINISCNFYHEEGISLS